MKQHGVLCHARATDVIRVVQTEGCLHRLHSWRAGAWPSLRDVGPDRSFRTFLTRTPPRVRGRMDRVGEQREPRAATGPLMGASAVSGCSFSRRRSEDPKEAPGRSHSDEIPRQVQSVRAWSECDARRDAAERGMQNMMRGNGLGCSLEESLEYHKVVRLRSVVLEIKVPDSIPAMSYQSAALSARCDAARRTC